MTNRAKAVGDVKIAMGAAAAASTRAGETIEQYRETLVAMRDAIDASIRKCDDEIAERDRG